MIDYLMLTVRYQTVLLCLHRRPGLKMIARRLRTLWQRLWTKTPPDDSTMRSADARSGLEEVAGLHSVALHGTVFFDNGDPF